MRWQPSKISSSSSIYYPGEFSLLAEVGQYFHCFPPTLPIPFILLHNSPLFHVLVYHVNPLFHWPASLSSSFYFQLEHFISTSSSLLTVCLNNLYLFCLKSSKSSTPNLNAITVLSTLSFNVTSQIILSILLAHSF